MAKTTKSESSPTKPRKKPALTPEARENQLISLAYDLAERQLLDGTISASALTELLKAGSRKREKELAKLDKENDNLIAKTEALQSAKRVEELYSEAMAAFRSYSGLGADNHDN